MSSKDQMVSVPRDELEAACQRFAKAQIFDFSRRMRALLDQPAEQPKTPHNEAVVRFGIQVEKALCAALGREWSATGISIETLIAELKARGARPQCELQLGAIKTFGVVPDRVYDRDKFGPACHLTEGPLYVLLSDYQALLGASKAHHDALLQICTTLGMPAGSDVHRDGPALANALRNLLHSQDNLLAERSALLRECQEDGDLFSELSVRIDAVLSGSAAVGAADVPLSESQLQAQANPHWPASSAKELADFKEWLKRENQG